jgi:hypothetical protein
MIGLSCDAILHELELDDGKGSGGRLYHGTYHCVSQMGWDGIRSAGLRREGMNGIQQVPRLLFYLLPICLRLFAVLANIYFSLVIVIHLLTCIEGGVLSSLWVYTIQKMESLITTLCLMPSDSLLSASQRCKNLTLCVTKSLNGFFLSHVFLTLSIRTVLLKLNRTS